MNALDFVNMISDQLGYGLETDVADLSEDGRKILRITNLMLQSMQNDKNWPELAKEGYINIVPLENSPYTDLASIDFGDTDVLIDIADPGLFDSDDVGKLIQLMKEQELDPDLEQTPSSGTHYPYYRIKSVTDLHTAVLEAPWKDVEVADHRFCLGVDKYELPSDMDRMLNGLMRNATTGNDVVEVDSREMKALKAVEGMNMVPEEPEHFTISGLSTSGNKMLHVDRVSGEYYTLHYNYQMKHPTLTASDDEILYPDKYLLYAADSIIAKLQRDVENSAQAVQTSQDSLKEAVKVGSNPNDSRDRMRIRIPGVAHGGYRRR